MIEFKTRHIELGQIKENTTQTIVFTAQQELPPNLEVTSSCGCSTPKIRNKKDVVVIYKVGKIPRHLRTQGFAKTSKKIFIKDPIKGETTELSFQGLIVK